MRFYGDLMGVYGDLMGIFIGSFMGFTGIYIYSLVGGFEPSLWKIWVSWGYYSQLNGKSFKIPWFQSPPTSIWTEWLLIGLNMDWINQLLWLVNITMKADWIEMDWIWVSYDAQLDQTWPLGHEVMLLHRPMAPRRDAKVRWWMWNGKKVQSSDWSIIIKVSVYT